MDLYKMISDCPAFRLRGFNAAGLKVYCVSGWTKVRCSDSASIDKKK